MEYFRLLGLKREPFSSTPDPRFFYLSDEYRECLQKLEISIRLRRGLNVILGEVGTGKTTISRVLLRQFQQDTEIFQFHYLLDPGFNSDFQFFKNLVSLFGIDTPKRSTFDYREEIQKYLFRMGVEEHKTVVLVIDEGQKLSRSHIEILRTLLNYETNEYKLLQVILFAQMEFLDRVRGLENFTDRINMTYKFFPLDEVQTRKLIDYRLKVAGLNHGSALFTNDGYMAVFMNTMGYPRRIITLCHHALLTMMIRGNERVDETVVRLAFQTGGSRI
jgi:general secretion pathway protein A